MQIHKFLAPFCPLSGMLSEIEQSTTINHGPDMHAILFRFWLSVTLCIVGCGSYARKLKFLKSQVRAHEKSCPVITPSLRTSCTITVQWRIFCNFYNINSKFKYWLLISNSLRRKHFHISTDTISFFLPYTDFQKWKDPLMQSNSIDIFVANHHFLCTPTAPGQKCEVFKLVFAIPPFSFFPDLQKFSNEMQSKSNSIDIFCCKSSCFVHTYAL